MSRWSFAAVFSVLLSAGIATPRGDIVALRKFNGGLESTHTSFPEGHPQAAQRQALRGDLAAFDPHCSSCTPDGFTHSHLPKGGGHAILSDKALSLLHPNGSLLQVAPLSQSCIPLYLQPSLIDPSIPFLVVCRNSCYQGVTWKEGAISLTPPTACGQSGGVFVESHGELFLVTYSDSNIDEYSFASATFYSPPLPDVHCEGSGDLYPLHGQESYLLRCNTADGPALYVISLSIHGSQVRPISAPGRPQSAPDGEHFIVVDDSSLRLYVTANETVTPQAKTFSSDITHTEFMNSRYLSLSTEGGEHVLVDIQHIFSVSAAGEAIVKLTGGHPLAMLWIDPDAYVYITRDTTSALKMCSYNVTSGKELEVGEIVDAPDLLVFMKNSVEMPPNEVVDNGGTGSDLSTGAIAAIIIIGCALLLGVVVVVIVCILVLRHYKQPIARYVRLLNRHTTTTPIAGTPEPGVQPEDEEKPAEDTKPGDSDAHAEPDSSTAPLQRSQVIPVQETQTTPDKDQILLPAATLPGRSTPEPKTQQEGKEEEPSGKGASSKSLGSEDFGLECSSASLLPNRVMEPAAEGAPVTPNGGQALPPPALLGFIELKSMPEGNTTSMSCPPGQCESENPQHDQFVGPPPKAKP